MNPQTRLPRQGGKCSQLHYRIRIDGGEARKNVGNAAG
jgi:hypothetical protein